MWTHLVARHAEGRIATAARVAAALFVTLAAAKVTLLALRAIDGGRFDALRVLVLVREEAIVSLAAGTLDLAVGTVAGNRPSPGVVRGGRWAGYAALVALSAVNVPVARVFATPLTASMLDATGAALGDSIGVYFTVGNAAAVALVVALGAALPAAFRRLPVAVAASTVAVAAASATAGVAAARGVDTLGLHRDALLTLARTELTRTPWGSPGEAAMPCADTLAEEDASTRGVDLRHLAAAARGRHVVWIILESTGARYLAAYGATDDPTPNLTRLASQAIVFDHAYAVYPESIKGLYAMLCSFSPAPHTKAQQYDAAGLPCRSIAQVLAEDGYRSALYHSGRFGYLGMEHVVERRGFDRLLDAQEIGGKFQSSFGCDDMSTASAVLKRFDERAPDEKLFLAYMPISGHHPYETAGDGPRPFGEATDFDRYKSDLYRGDLALGALVEGLKARGVWQNTLLVIHGDHGEAFLQHEGNFAHTLEAYDENLHVPLLVVAPGLTTRTIRAAQLVSLLDIAPTLVDLIGGKAPAGWEGRSALHPGPRVVRSFTDQRVLKLALRTGRHKLVLDTEAGRAQLFDMTLDPDERRDISDVDAARTAAYVRDVKVWSARQRMLVEKGVTDPAPREGAVKSRL
jgi:arylsulfatase A-like enzyme